MIVKFIQRHKFIAATISAMCRDIFTFLEVSLSNKNVTSNILILQNLLHLPQGYIKHRTKDIQTAYFHKKFPAALLLYAQPYRDNMMAEQGRKDEF